MKTRWAALLAMLALLGSFAAYAIGTRTKTDVRVDAGTGCTWLVDIDTQGVQEWITPTGQAAFIMDEQGDRAGVSDNGALRTVNASGLPLTAIEAAGQDAYVTIMTTSVRCHNCAVYAQTKAVQVSFDGGLTDGPCVPMQGAADGGMFFTGLDIPAGAQIAVRNAAAGANYANVRVSVW